MFCYLLFFFKYFWLLATNLMRFFSSLSSDTITILDTHMITCLVISVLLTFRLGQFAAPSHNSYLLLLTLWFNVKSLKIHKNRKTCLLLNTILRVQYFKCHLKIPVCTICPVFTLKKVIVLGANVIFWILFKFP